MHRYRSIGSDLALQLGLLKLPQNIRSIEGECHYLGYGLHLKFRTKAGIMDAIESNDFF